MPTAVVTGAGVRVGAAIARALLHDGWDLALHAHASTAGAAVIVDEARARGRTAAMHPGDLSTEAGVDAVAASVNAAHAAIDLVVHNAAVFESVDFAAIDRARWRRMQAINVEAPFFLTQALLPALLRAPSPSIVMLADVAGERPMNRYAHYCVSKAGVVMLTKALAVELGPRVRVNAIAPGAVMMPDGFDEGVKQRVLRRVPLGREGDADDVAGAVLYLARAAYVTGHVLHVDGGRSARL